MAVRQRRLDEGKRRAVRLLAELGIELRDARLAAGLSQRAVAAAAATSQSQVGRIERAESPRVAFRLLVVVGSVLGSDLAARFYSADSPLRDRGHIALMVRFRRLCVSAIRWRFEVPIRRGDQRCWDSVGDCSDGPVMLEAETVIRDIQALDRRLGRKIADSRATCVVLLIADTRANRAALVEGGFALRARFPLTHAEVMRALAKGRRPLGNGIVML